MICLCGVKHRSIGSLSSCNAKKAAWMRSCKASLLQDRSSYDPATDMCKIQPPEKILLNPEESGRGFDIDKDYISCKQAVGMQSLTDRRYASTQGCVRGKPCALRSRLNLKKHYMICLCGVKHGSIAGGPAACNRQKAAWTRNCR